MSLRAYSALISLLLLLPAAASAQTGEASGVPTWQEIAFPAFSVPLHALQAQEQLNPAAPAQAPAQKTPEPYEEDEFPQWARDLWRGCVIAVGSFPFTYFFTLEGYEIYRYAANEFDPLYAPWPFTPASDILYTDEEKIGLIVTAVSASLLTAAADWIIGFFSEDR